MKSYKKIAAVIMTSLAVSAISANSQTLDLSGGTLEGSSTNELLQTAPPTLANDGSITTWVVNDSTIDSSGYIFIYQVVNNGPDVMESVALNTYSPSEVIGTGSFSSLVGSLTLPGSYSPSAAGSFTFDDISAGGAATFQGGDLPNANTPSWFLVIDTHLTSIGSGYATTQDSVNTYGNILVPLPVPEPATLALMSTGLAGLLFFKGFRKRH